jgi:hypothetical protein
LLLVFQADLAKELNGLVVKIASINGHANIESVLLAAGQSVLADHRVS